MDEPEAIGHRQTGLGMPAGVVEHEHDGAALTGAGLPRESGEQRLEERLGHTVRELPDYLARGRLHERRHVQPLVAVMAESDRAAALGRPDPAGNRLQPKAVLVAREDLDRPLRGLGALFGDNLLELFLNASRSSGVAAAGWRGRGT